MRYIFHTFTFLVLLVLSLVIQSSQVFAQNLPAINCTFADDCQVRLTYSGRIVVYQHSANLLYIETSPGISQYQMYDLSTHRFALEGGQFDFVTFDEAGYVVFTAETISGNTLSLYNVTSRTFETLDLSSLGRLSSCNPNYQRTIVSRNYISRLGNTNQMLVCVFDSTQNFIVYSLTVPTGAVSQSLNFGQSATLVGGLNTPWAMLFAGHDSNLYIDQPRLSLSPLLQSVANPPPNLPQGSTLVLRYSPTTNEWRTLVVNSEERFGDINYLSYPSAYVSFNALSATDRYGKLYFYTFWQNGTEPRLGFDEISRLDPITGERALVNSRSVATSTILSGISATGEILFRVGTQISGSEIVNMDDYIIDTGYFTPTPVPTATETATHTPTPVDATATVTPTP